VYNSEQKHPITTRLSRCKNDVDVLF